MASRVRSSSVGPMPPVQTTRSASETAISQDARQPLQVVADLDDVEQLDAFGGEFLGEEGGVGVGEVAADELAADGEHVGAHASLLFGLGGASRPTGAALPSTVCG